MTPKLREFERGTRAGEQQSVVDLDQGGALAQSVADAFAEAVPYSRFTGQYQDANGLTIFCPTTPNAPPTYVIYREWYIDQAGIPLAFVADTQWDEFLQAYWSQFK